MKPNIILDLTFELGVKALLYSEELKNKRHFSLADQVMRAGLSIGANINEAQGAESRADFIHKCKIAYKEAEELRFFLRVIKATSTFPFSEQLLEITISTLKVLSRIIVTSKRKAPRE